jgi:hypothetical protein
MLFWKSDFNSNLFIKSINFYLSFIQLMSSYISILESSKIMSEQSFGGFWINNFNVLKNIEDKQEWHL